MNVSNLIKELNARLNPNEIVQEKEHKKEMKKFKETDGDLYIVELE